VLPTCNYRLPSFAATLTANTRMLKTVSATPVPESSRVGHKVPYEHSVPECRRKAVIEDIPHEELVDSLTKHLRMAEIGRVARVCTKLWCATARHVELPAQAWQSLRWWRETARATRTAWQTVMMWRGNTSRLAMDSYTESMMEELEEMMESQQHAEEADLTDEEVDFLEHHMMKQTWEALTERVSQAHLVRETVASSLSLAKPPFHTPM